MPININNLPSNNIDGDDEIRPVVSGVVRRRASKPSSRFANDIIEISSTLWDEVVIPAVKSGVSDFIANGIEMIFWGGGSSHNDRRSGGSRRNYGSYSNRRGSRSRVEPDRRRRAKPNHGVRVDDIFFESRRDAELVLGRMYELIAEYGWCSVGDLYSSAGISSDQSHERYGWMNIEGSKIKKTLDGFYLDLPKPDYDN